MQSDKQNSDASELANIDAGLAEGDEREEKHVAIDAAELCHLAAAAVGHVLAAFRQNHLYWQQ